MRVAVAGKGGAGKTTISSTLARTVARTGTPVVAVDADSNPNLAPALGIRDLDVHDAAIPAGVVSRKLHGPALSPRLDDVLAAHSVPGPDGIRLVHMGAPGHAEEGCMCAAHATVSALLAELGAHPERFVVIDMEASPEHFSRGTTRHVDVLMLVTEPYYRSLETVRRMAELARELPIARLAVVGNKVRSDDEGQAIAEFCERHDLEHLVNIPWGEEVVDADIARRPLIEVSPGSAPAQAIHGLAARLHLPGAVQV